MLHIILTATLAKWNKKTGVLSSLLILNRTLNFAFVWRVFENNGFNEYDGCAGWATAGLGYSLTGR